MSIRKTNRLAQESSPYLLQHAHNPVDWYPWGPEAFEKARREDKPLLISIGYSTCHWCHVMERESFEVDEIATVMNDNVVAVKVDREERPDIDKIYMTAVSAMTGQGGWPLNVFVTPDLKPIYGGSYFPPASKWGQPAWPDVVRHIGAAWKDPEERHKILEAAGHLTETLKRYTSTAAKPLQADPSWLQRCLESLEHSYDRDRGGFGNAPKFPMPVYHQFLLRYAADHSNAAAREMSLSTLQAMARGGIYDQLGGGFSRYSTDAYWHVPHFEKMLYDNAQLAECSLMAYQTTQDPLYARISRETLDYILRDMTSPEGGYCSAEDADSLETPESEHKTEGAFYVWTKAEIEALLDRPTADLFCFHYGVRAEGNARVDPHGEFIQKNILYIAHPIPEVAREFKRTEADVEHALTQARQILFEARARRARPQRDDKQISAWNGLMISAMAKGGLLLSEPRYLGSAQKAAGFILLNLFDSEQKVLYRSWRLGKRQAQGISDDYAFMAKALLDLYQADFNPQWLDEADGLMRLMIDRFYDPAKKGFYMTAADQDDHLLLRMSEDQDNVEPAASSVAVMNLVRLSWIKDDARLASLAQGIVESLGETLRDSPRALPALLSGMDMLLLPPQELVIAGDPSRADTQSFLKARSRYDLPRLQVFVIAESDRSHPILQRFKSQGPMNDQTTAYLCVNHACQTPTNSPEELERQLKALHA